MVHTLATKTAFDYAYNIAVVATRLALARNAFEVARHELAMARRLSGKLRNPSRCQHTLESLEVQVSRGAPLPDATPEALLERTSTLDDAEVAFEAVSKGVLKWPMHEALAMRYCELLVALDFRDAAEEELKKRITTNPSAVVYLGELYLRAARHRELETLAGELLNSPSATTAHWLLARSAFAQNKDTDCISQLEKVLQLAPQAQNARRLWIQCAKRAHQFDSMLLRTSELLDLSNDDTEKPNLRWQLIIAATALGRWPIVRDFARQLGMTFDGDGPIDTDDGLIRLRFRTDDGPPVDRWAVRTGPVTARVVQLSRPSMQERFADVVLFEPTPVSQEEASNEPHTFEAITSLRSGGYSTFVLHGFHPGEEAMKELEGAFTDTCVVQVLSDEEYVLVEPLAGESAPGLYALLGVPQTMSAESLNRLLLEKTNTWNRGVTWTELARAAGDKATADKHEAFWARLEAV